MVYGDGNQTRDFVYVDDLCAGVTAAMLSGARGVVAHLGTGVETKVVDVAKALVPNARMKSVGIEFRPARSGDMVRNCADITRAHELFGYRQATRLEEALAGTMSWFRGYAAV